MSGHGGGRGAAGTANFQRRTWDREAYAQKAAERAERELAGDFLKEDDARRAPAPYRAAAPGMKGPEGSDRAFISARDYDLHLDAKLGKKRLVTEATPVSQTGGYWCEVCQCTLRDSTAYLDHINGVRHQRRLGFSMRVERASVDDVKAKLAALSGGSSAAPAASSMRGPRMDADDRHAMAAMNVGSGSHRRRHRSPSRSRSSSPERARTRPTKYDDEPNGDAARDTRRYTDAARSAPSEEDRRAAISDAHVHAEGGAAAEDSNASALTDGGRAGDSGGAAAAEQTTVGAEHTKQDDGTADDFDIAAVMGFAGFGGTGKKR